jgi:hypothetical protein
VLRAIRQDLVGGPCQRDARLFAQVKKGLEKEKRLNFSPEADVE